MKIQSVIRIAGVLGILAIGVQSAHPNGNLNMIIACQGTVMGLSNQFADATITFKPNGKAYPEGAFLLEPFDYIASETVISLNTPRGCRMPLPDLKNTPDVCRSAGGVDRGTGEITIYSFGCSGPSCKMYENYKGRCDAFKKVF